MNKRLISALAFGVLGLLLLVVGLRRWKSQTNPQTPTETNTSEGGSTNE